MHQVFTQKFTKSSEIFTQKSSPGLHFQFRSIFPRWPAHHRTAASRGVVGHFDAVETCQQCLRITHSHMGVESFLPSRSGASGWSVKNPWPHHQSSDWRIFVYVNQVVEVAGKKILHHIFEYGDAHHVLNHQTLTQFYPRHVVSQAGHPCGCRWALRVSLNAAGSRPGSDPDLRRWEFLKIAVSMARRTWRMGSSLGTPLFQLTWRLLEKTPIFNRNYIDSFFIHEWVFRCHANN